MIVETEINDRSIDQKDPEWLKIALVKRVWELEERLIRLGEDPRPEGKLSDKEGREGV